MRALLEAVAGQDGAISRDSKRGQKGMMLDPSYRERYESELVQATREALRTTDAKGHVLLTFYDRSGRAVTQRVTEISDGELVRLRSLAGVEDQGDPNDVSMGTEMDGVPPERPEPTQDRVEAVFDEVASVLEARQTASVSYVDAFFARGAGVVEGEGYKLEPKKGAKDYWYVKVGGKTIGVVSSAKGGKFDADTDPNGKGEFRNDFDSPEAAAKWVMSKTSKSESLEEAQRVDPGLAFPGMTDEKKTKPGAFKISSVERKLIKKEMPGFKLGDTMFKQVRDRVANIQRDHLATVMGKSVIADAQDVVARNPRSAFLKFLTKIGHVDPKLGTYIRRRPEFASIIFHLFVTRLSGSDMADVITKRYFMTQSSHPGELTKKRMERLDNVDTSLTEAKDIVTTQVFGQEPGDFRGFGSSNREYHLTVSGNTFPIKDKLSALGLRFDRKTKEWSIAHVQSSVSGRSPYWSVPIAKVKEAIPKVEKLIKEFNKSTVAAASANMAKRGFSANKALKKTRDSVEAAFSSIRRKANLDRHNIKLDIAWGGNGTAAQATVRFTGDTYPIKDILKRAGMSFNPRERAWSMSYALYSKHAKSIDQAIIRSLKKVEDTEGFVGDSLSEDIRPINPYANGMWVIRFEDELYKLTGQQRWTWKKPIVKMGKNTLRYKWVALKPPGKATPPMVTMAIEYDEGLDLFNVTMEAYDSDMKSLVKKTMKGAYIEDVTSAKKMIGLLKGKLKGKIK